MTFTAGKGIGLALGLAAYAAIRWLDSPLHHFGEYGDRPAQAAAVTALMAIWWLSEALPITVTACAPLLLYPWSGVFEGGAATAAVATVKPYVDSYIFLFMGGMCIAAAMQQCDLHRRIALTIMRAIGTDPRRVLLGLLVATAFISMWISNTATAAMMLPIGLAVISQTERQSGGVRLASYGAALMLAVAYGANIGGIGTKIGTAPNAYFAGFMQQRGIEVSFLQFLAVGLPFIVLFLPIAWWFLWRVGRADAPVGASGVDTIRSELAGLGPTKASEKAVLAVFFTVVALWIAGKSVTGFLASHVKAFKVTAADVEGAVAMGAALLLMVLSVGGRRTLELRSLQRVPWGTLLLLGGAFSMAEGVQQSGLSLWLGAQLEGLRGLAPLAQTVLAAVTTVVISAVASNTATSTVMLGVLADATAPEHMPTVLFAATISASCDFALPAGTPPNAIVFGSGYLTVARMAKTGVVLDLAAALLAAFLCFIVVPRVL